MGVAVLIRVWMRIIPECPSSGYGLLGAPEGLGCMVLSSLEVERFVDRV